MVRALLFTCVVCLLTPGLVRAQNASAPQDVTQISTLLEQQNSWKFECKANYCILNGDVELPLPGGQGKFFADQIELFGDKDLLVASGNVVFANAEGRLAAEKAEFDLKKQTGTFYTASGTMPLGSAADPRQFGRASRPTCTSGARPSNGSAIRSIASRTAVSRRASSPPLAGSFSPALLFSISTTTLSQRTPSFA